MQYRQYRRRDLLLVPNLLSAARVPLAFAFVFAAPHPVAAVAVLAAAATTDVLDGWLARRMGQTTPLGALVDGVADKVFGVAVLASLVAYGLLAAPLAILLATREIGELPLALRVLASRAPRLGTVDRRANALGKAATTLEITAVVAVVFGVSSAHVAVLVGVTAAIGAAAALSYWSRELRASRTSSVASASAPSAAASPSPARCHQTAYAP